MQRHTLRIVFAVVILGAVTALSLLPGHDLPAVPAGFPFTLPHADKIIHFGFYFCAGLAFLYAAGSRSVLNSRLCRWGTILLLAGYGALMEVLQRFTPARSFDFGDMLANTAGALTALFIAVFFLRLTGKGRPMPPVTITFTAAGRTPGGRNRP